MLLVGAVLKNAVLTMGWPQYAADAASMLHWLVLQTHT